MSPEPQHPADQRDLKIAREELEDVVAIAAKLQSAKQTARDETFEGDEIDTIVETTGLTRDQLAEAQALLRAKEEARFVRRGVATVILVVVVMVGALSWRKATQPLPKPAGHEVARLDASVDAVQARDMITKLYRVDKRPTEAIAYGTRAVGKFPNDVQVWNALGLAYEADGQLDEAKRCYTKAVEVGGDARVACYPHHNLGRLFEDAGNRPQAIAAYQAALQADPTMTKAQQGLQRLGASR